MQTNRPKYVKSKVRECKLTSGVNWQGTLKQKDIKPRGVKQVPGIYACICGFFIFGGGGHPVVPCHISINVLLTL